MTKDEMIQEIIDYSDGVYHMHQPDGWEELDEATKSDILDEVFKEVYPCDGCGWWTNVSDMSNFPDSGEDLCWRCESEREEEE